MRELTINAPRIRNFGESRASLFCLVTSRDLADRFTIEIGDKYASSLILPYDGAPSFGRFIEDHVPENAHILTILPNVYVKSPTPGELGGARKLCVMACFSTPTTRQSIAHFIDMAERTDPDEQERMAERFFAHGERAKQLVFCDPAHQTKAVFAHAGDELSWHEQIGTLDWGQQQLLPAGEISVLPVNVFGQDIDTRFDLNGELALRGYPVLHSGTPSFLPSDQERVYSRLASCRDHAVIARLEKGKITALTPTAPQCRPAAEMLEAMFDVDSRYRNLLEIGFGINLGMELFSGNSAMNEVYGGRSGAVHFGLGLIPYTQYHLDLICPGTIVLDESGDSVFGGDGTEGVGPAGADGLHASDRLGSDRLGSD